MKKITLLLLVLLLALPSALATENYAGDVVVEEDVVGFVITAWDEEPLWDGHTGDYLLITHVGADADLPLPETITSESMNAYTDDVWHWAEANRGYGDLNIVKVDAEDFLRFCYDGTTEDPDQTADDGFADYGSAYYPGATEGQLKRLYAVKDCRIAYAMFFHDAAGVHTALRIEWIPDGEGSATGGWRVSDFYRDNVRDYKEMEVCARFGYYDYVGGVEVTTETGNLNVRAWPNGDIIGSLKKGSTITIYRCEEIADNEIPFTLISKWTEPDADGRSSLEYFGWVASEYITEDPDWVWVYGD